MAKPNKKPTPSTPQGTADDAFTARVLEFYVWARQRTQLLTVVAVVAVLVVVGGIYWMNQRSARADRAALELETIQQAVAFGDPGEARAQLTTFVDRFGGTPFAVEARITLAQLELEQGNTAAAIEVLEAVAPAFRNPLQVQASFLLAVAYEQASNWSAAGEVYEALEDQVRFNFQRMEAGEGLARVRLAQEDTTGAAEAFRRMIADLEEGNPQRAYYEMRLAELTRGEM